MYLLESLSAINPQAMIRSATSQDIDELLRLEHLCFEHDRLKRTDFRNALRSIRTLILVEDDGGALAAYALLRMQGRKGHLQSLAVDSTDAMGSAQD